VKLFEEQKQHLSADDVNTILKRNMNLWREEDLPDKISWMINAETEFDDGLIYDLKDLENHVFHSEQSPKGTYELNPSITIEFVKKIISHEKANELCDFDRLASNPALDEDDIRNVAGDWRLGILSNPNLTLKGFKIIESGDWTDISVLYDMLWANQFIWNYDTCWTAHDDDVRERLAAAVCECLPQDYAGIVATYIDYK
jgi:hypothetical protein